MKYLKILVFILLLTGCSRYSTYVDISYDKLYKKLDNKENFVFVVGNPTCHNCSALKIVMDQIIEEENLKIYYLDSSLLSDEEELIVATQFFNDKGSIYTPVMFVIEGGHLKDKLVGSKVHSVALEFLVKNGIVEE